MEGKEVLLYSAARRPFSLREKGLLRKGRKHRAAFAEPHHGMVVYHVGRSLKPHAQDKARHSKPLCFWVPTPTDFFLPRMRRSLDQNMFLLFGHSDGHRISISSGAPHRRRCRDWSSKSFNFKNRNHQKRPFVTKCANGVSLGKVGLGVSSRTRPMDKRQFATCHQKLPLGDDACRYHP